MLFDGVHYSLSPSLTETRINELTHVLDANGAVHLSGGIDDASLTHFITDTHRFEGWRELKQREEDGKVAVVTDKWVDRSMVVGKIQMSPSYYSADPAMIFSGIIACASELPAPDLEVLSAGITALGGQWRMALTKDVTHLFCISSSSPKYATAFHFQEHTQVRVLLPHWFDDAVRLGTGALDTAPYEWPDPPILKTVGSSNEEAEKERHDALKKAALKKSDPEKTALFRSASLLDPQAPLPTPPDAATKNVWQSRRILLGRSLELYGGRKEAIEAGVRRAGGVIVPFTCSSTLPSSSAASVSTLPSPEKFTDEENARKSADKALEIDLIQSCDVFVTRYRCGASYAAALRAHKTIGTLPWVFHIQSTGVFASPLDQLLWYPIPRQSIEGFRGHEITLTNYTGESREYLKRLITLMGARFTPSMSGKNTVLVAAYKSGTKATKAASWSIPIVNHVWLEDCFVKWRNLTCALEKYISFPSGIDFSTMLGQRGIGRAVEDVGEDELDALEAEESDEELTAEDEAEEGEGKNRDTVNGKVTMNGTQNSAREAREVEEVVNLTMDVDDVEVPQPQPQPTTSQPRTSQKTLAERVHKKEGESAARARIRPKKTAAVVEEKEKEEGDGGDERDEQTTESERPWSRPIRYRTKSKSPAKGKKKRREEEDSSYRDDGEPTTTTTANSPGSVIAPNSLRKSRVKVVSDEDDLDLDHESLVVPILKKGGATGDLQEEEVVSRSERSRKRMVEEDEEEEEEEEEVSRKRGRPALPGGTDEEEEETEKEVSSKRGRLVKRQGTVEDDEEEEEEEVSLRKKGRPAKRQNTVEDDDKGTEIPTRKRGRPAQRQSMIEDDEEEDSQRRQRRPLKRRIPAEDDGEVEEEKEKVSRKRGRPKRQSTVEDGGNGTDLPRKQGRLTRQRSAIEDEEEVSPQQRGRLARGPNTLDEENPRKRGRPAKRQSMVEGDDETVAPPRKRGRPAKRKESDDDERASPKVSPLRPRGRSSKGAREVAEEETIPQKKGSPWKPEDGKKLIQEPPTPRRTSTARPKSKQALGDLFTDDEDPVGESPLKGKGKAKVLKPSKSSQTLKRHAAAEEEGESEVEVISAPMSGVRGKRKGKQIEEQPAKEKPKAKTKTKDVGRGKKVQPEVAEDDDDDATPPADPELRKSLKPPARPKATKVQKAPVLPEVESLVDEDEAEKDTTPSPTRSRAPKTTPKQGSSPIVLLTRKGESRKESLGRTGSTRAIADERASRPAASPAPVASGSKSRSHARPAPPPTRAPVSSPLTALEDHNDDDDDSASRAGGGRMKRSAGVKASQKLRDEVMPDVVNYEHEKRIDARRRSLGLAPAVPAKFLSAGDEKERNKRGKEGEDDGGARKKRRVSMPTGESEEEGIESGKGKGKKKANEVEQEPVDKGKKVDKAMKEDMSMSKAGNVRLMTTQVTLSDDVTKALVKLGVKMTIKPAECTHLLAPHLVRTEKFLCALAVAPYVLTESWAIDSAAAKKLLDEDKYILRDPVNEGKYKVNLVDSLRRARQLRGTLFEKKIFYVTPKVPVDIKLLKNIVTAFGGQVSTQVPTVRILNANRDRHVISCADDISIWRPIAQHHPIYTQELLLIGALKQEIDWKDVFFQVKDSVGLRL